MTRNRTTLETIQIKARLQNKSFEGTTLVFWIFFGPSLLVVVECVLFLSRGTSMFVTVHTEGSVLLAIRDYYLLS